jgi:hypothetical protein
VEQLLMQAVGFPSTGERFPPRVENLESHHHNKMEICYQYIFFRRLVKEFPALFGKILPFFHFSPILYQIDKIQRESTRREKRVKSGDSIKWQDLARSYCQNYQLGN